MDRTLGTFLSAYMRSIGLFLYFLIIIFLYIVFYIKFSSISMETCTMSVSKVAAAASAPPRYDESEQLIHDFHEIQRYKFDKGLLLYCQFYYIFLLL